MGNGMGTSSFPVPPPSVDPSPSSEILICAQFQNASPLAFPGPHLLMLLPGRYSGGGSGSCSMHEFIDDQYHWRTHLDRTPSQVKSFGSLYFIVYSRGGSFGPVYQYCFPGACSPALIFSTFSSRHASVKAAFSLPVYSHILNENRPWWFALMTSLNSASWPRRYVTCGSSL